MEDNKTSANPLSEQQINESRVDQESLDSISFMHKPTRKCFQLNVISLLNTVRNGIVMELPSLSVRLQCHWTS